MNADRDEVRGLSPAGLWHLVEGPGKEEGRVSKGGGEGAAVEEEETQVSLGSWKPREARTSWNMARSNVSNAAEELQARLELPAGIEPWCLSVT